MELHVYLRASFSTFLYCLLEVSVLLLELLLVGLWVALHQVLQLGQVGGQGRVLLLRHDAEAVQVLLHHVLCMTRG